MSNDDKIPSPSSLPLGRYRHYKGNEYTLLGIARHSETLEELVVYRPEYGDRGWWVRPRTMFTEFIEVSGRVVRRFQPLDSPTAWLDGLTLRRSESGDRDALSEVHEQAFLRRDEADLVERLLEGPWTVLSLLAEEAGRPIGHLVLSRLEIRGESEFIPSLALAPVSVLPSFQRRGVGQRLINAALDLARQAGEQSVFVLGEPAYYGRFGFQPELARPFDCEYACDAFLALELIAGSLNGLTGRLIYADPFRA